MATSAGSGYSDHASQLKTILSKYLPATKKRGTASNILRCALNCHAMPEKLVTCTVEAIPSLTKAQSAGHCTIVHYIRTSFIQRNVD